MSIALFYTVIILDTMHTQLVNIKYDTKFVRSIPVCGAVQAPHFAAHRLEVSLEHPGGLTDVDRTPGETER